MRTSKNIIIGVLITMRPPRLQSFQLPRPSQARNNDNFTRLFKSMSANLKRNRRQDIKIEHALFISTSVWGMSQNSDKVWECELWNVITRVDHSLYTNQINARALIGRSSVGFCAGKPTEKCCVFRIIILVYLNGNNATEGENNIKYASSYPFELNSEELICTRL